MASKTPEQREKARLRRAARAGRRAKNHFPPKAAARSTASQSYYRVLVDVARQYTEAKEWLASATQETSVGTPGVVDDQARIDVKVKRGILRGAALMMHDHEEFYGYFGRSVEDIEKRALKEVLLMRKYPERYEGVGEVEEVSAERKVRRG